MADAELSEASQASAFSGNHKEVLDMHIVLMSENLQGL